MSLCLEINLISRRPETAPRVLLSSSFTPAASTATRPRRRREPSPRPPTSHSYDLRRTSIANNDNFFLSLYKDYITQKKFADVITTVPEHVFIKRKKQSYKVLTPRKGRLQAMVKQEELYIATRSHGPMLTARISE